MVNSFPFIMIPDLTVNVIKVYKQKK